MKIDNSPLPQVRKPRRLPKLLLLLILAATLVWGGQRYQLPLLIQNIEWLKVREVVITAPWPLSPDLVKAWLPPLQGKNILWVDGSQIISKLKEQNWVREVTLKKDYPNHLRIEVTAKAAKAIEIEKGLPYFVDENGARIEKASPLMLSAWDLPVITREKEGSEWVERAIIRPPLARKVWIPSPWRTVNAIEVLTRLQNEIDPRYTVSQISLGSYPYYRVFFSRPRLEVLFSIETWDAQLPILALLVHSPPRQIGQPQRINLVLPKKAVVSSLLVH